MSRSCSGNVQVMFRQSYQVLCRVKIVKIQSQIQRNFQRKTEPKTEINPLFWAKNRDETNGTFDDDILS